MRRSNSSVRYRVSINLFNIGMIVGTIRLSSIAFLALIIISSHSRLDFKYLSENAFKETLSRTIKFDRALLPSLMACSHCVFATLDPSGVHAGIILFHPQQEQLYDWLNLTVSSLNNTFSRNRQYHIVDSFILLVGRDWHMPSENIANITTLAFARRKGSPLLCIPWPLLSPDKDGNEIGYYVDAKDKYYYDWRLSLIHI